jgi:CheY-like chemotaxis protein
LKRVLFIDDEALLCRVAERLLGRRFAVVTANNGREALDVLREGSDFAVIFCDLTMPEMGGYEFWKALQDAFPELSRRLVVMTGSGESPHLEDLRASGVPFLAKPFRAAELNELANEIAER